MTKNYEKLGAFYLGRRHDTEKGKTLADPVLYDSADLTTHAVIIGMTGSGKTGLGIGLIEEAAIDHIPVIAIDPKGDMGNLLLSFPDLAPSDFQPWVDPRQASESGKTVETFAAAQAALWKKGLASWDQEPERIKRFREAVDMAIYTPGSRAGLPLSILGAFSAPPGEILRDEDLYREQVQATATNLLALLGIDADPLESREHILVASILDHAWSAGRSLDLAALIAAIREPGFQRLGVLDLESFYPEKDRFKLALRLNNLLAAPGFAAWMEGDDLDARKLLYTETGQPRISIVSIAHLGDRERMFVVTLLLRQLISWMRSQPGTGSLRAILYIDELFGFMPPVANPPSKNLLLTLLKQARAYGVGLVLSTQNPVDLDYKGLSNAGTWFIGRLQTEQDQSRVMSGLRQASASEDQGINLRETLAGLGKRIFFLHNVHENQPVVFATRWVMSYLAGPMTRDQIQQITAGADGRRLEAPPVAGQDSGVTPSSDAPLLPPEIQQRFLTPGRQVLGREQISYHPGLLCSVQIHYSNATANLDHQREWCFYLPAEDLTDPVDWDLLDDSVEALENTREVPLQEARFCECPAELLTARNYRGWSTQLKRWVRQERPLRLLRNRKYRLTSQPEEAEDEFIARVRQVAREDRDRKISALRKKFQRRITTLENRLMRAQQAMDREEQQASSQRMDTMISFGTAVLGSLLGRKRISSSAASRMGTAVRKAGRMSKEKGDIERARQTVARVEEELESIRLQAEDEVAALEEDFEERVRDNTEKLIRAKASDVRLEFLGLGWSAGIVPTE